MTYHEFWLRYLRAHAKPDTRAMHYAGTGLVTLCVIFSVVTVDWRWLVAAPIAGYSFAWVAHFFIEKNKPETFGHPFWSLISDFRMTGLFVTRQLGKHLKEAGVE